MLAAFAPIPWRKAVKGEAFSGSSVIGALGFITSSSQSSFASFARVTKDAESDSHSKVFLTWTSTRTRSIIDTQLSFSLTPAAHSLPAERSLGMLRGCRLSCRPWSSATSTVAEALTPYPFQEVAIKRLLTPGRRGLLLADEMGLGKTVSVIGALNREPTIESVLVVAPKSVLHVWRLELSRWLARPDLSVGMAR